ncbi:hypothetical protein ACIA48_22865 [Mycobacterium sp. NPDC051804]|uniref:hypothetical protein n=1 Tax=Mycobacterium sp. NPDC051804 TaxID=3364295 RepID=UPI0037ABA00D
MRIGLVFIAAVVVLSSMTGLGAVAYGLVNARLITDARVLPASIKMLTVANGDVPVAIRVVTDAGVSEPSVGLRMLTRADDSPLVVEYHAGASRLTIGGSRPGLLGFSGIGEVKIVLPPHIARGLSVSVNQRSGSLTFDADLDQLIVRSDNSTVTLGGSARVIDIDVHNGDISTSNRIAVTESFTAETKSGNLSVEFRAAPRTTEAIANGDVDVGLPAPGRYRVTTQSERPDGKTTVTVRETTDPSAPSVTARSKIGNVVVTELR